jgi:hypothetical protein
LVRRLRAEADINQPTIAAEIVAKWPISEVATFLIEVRLVEHSGSDLLALSLSHFDPKQS